jgi:hypothetical protein
MQNDPLSTQLDTCAYLGWTNCTPSYTGLSWVFLLCKIASIDKSTNQTAENVIACRDDLNPANGVYALDSFSQRWLC